VTDDIIRDWLGLEPPDYLIVTGTLLLPGPRFPDADAEFHRLTHRIRDRQTNPQRHLTNPSPEVLKLIQERETLTAQKPGSKSDRRERRLALRRINDQLRPLVPSDNSLEELRQRTRTQAEAHAVLTRRDYPAVLAPERTLKPFLMAIQSRCTR
jgi:hypothetical protein